MWHTLFRSSLNAVLKLKWFLLLLTVLGLTGTAYAQSLTPDSSAPVSKRPSVVAAPNGVPLVDIAKPNAKGLSHNLFREFSVGTQGAVLNNSRQEAARSVLGGIVPGNPNLGDGAASVILNEVTGVSRSQLQGYLEVHGQRADVIVANPNGITCNGCGFINSPRATLTTGIPEIDGNGNLTGFRVENGDVTFGTLGANFSNIDIVDVLSRKIFINGRIDAKTLRLIAGHNRVNYNDVENPTELSTSTSNEIVIDSSLLGGMYVERLSIVANNKGTGVHMRGDMASSVGDISLRADGSITVGRVSSGRKLTIRSANKTVTGKAIGAAGAVDVDAKESITLDAVYSDSTIDLDSTLGGVTVSGEIISLGNITISGLNDLVLNLVESKQDITLTSDAGDISVDQSLADGKTMFSAGGTITANKIVSTNGTSEITATNADLSNGEFIFGNVIFSITNDLNLSNSSLKSDASRAANITINTKSLTHTSSSELVAGGHLYLTLSQSFTNRMVIGAFGDTVMKVAGDLTNIDTGLIGATNNVGIFVTGIVTNKDGAGLWATNGDLIIAGSDAGITHLAGGGFLLPGDLNSLVKNVKVLNSSAVIEAGRDIIIATGELENKRTNSVIENVEIWRKTYDFISGTIPSSWVSYDSESPSPSYNYGYLFDSRHVNYLIAENPFYNEDTDELLAGIPTPDDDIGNVLYDGTGWNWKKWLVYSSAGDAPHSVPTQFFHYITEDQLNETASTPAGKIAAGRDMVIISSGDIINSHSDILANNNMTLVGNNLVNEGAQPLLRRYYHELDKPGFVRSYGWTAHWFAGPIAPFDSKGPDLLRSAIQDDTQSFIIAGGTLNGSFRGKIDNKNLAENDPNNLRLTQNSLSGANLNPGNVGQTFVESSQIIDTVNSVSQLPGGNSLFTTNGTPGPQGFLYETRAPFIDVSKFYGSSYFLNRIGYYSNQSYHSDNSWGFQGNRTDAPSSNPPAYGAIGAYKDGRGYTPDTQVAFLGDAFFETRLIEQAVLRETGKRFLDETYKDAATQLKSLIDNGVDAQKDLTLSVGVGLTKDQINALTTDIVWYEERLVNGQKVLAPVLYLAERPKVDGIGAVIKGKEVNLNARLGIRNEGGRIASEGDLNLHSDEGSIELVAAKQKVQLDEKNFREWAGTQGVFSSGGNLTITTNKDFISQGGQLDVQKDLTLDAAENVTIGSLSLKGKSDFGVTGNYFKSTREGQVGSRAKVMGDTEIISQSGDINVIGSSVYTEGVTLLEAAKDVNIAAAESRYNVDTRVFAKGGFRKTDIDNKTLTSSQVASGKDLTIRSGKGTKVKASEVVAGVKEEGNLNIIAGEGVEISSGEEVRKYRHESKRKGFLSKNHRIEDIHDEQTVSSRIGASGDVNIIAESDVDIKASQLDAGKDLRIAAGTKLNDNNELTASGKDANVNITTNREDDSYFKYQKKSGFFAETGKGSFTAGYRKEKHISDTDTATHVLASLSAGQSVIITATKDIDANAPLITANDNIELTAGRDVNIKSVQDLFDHHESHKVSQFGVTVSVFENVTSSIKAFTDFDTGKGDGGAKAISTVSSTLRVIDAVSTLAGGNLAGVNIGVAFSSSKSTLDQTYKTAKGGVLQAGEDVKIDAGRDINTEGTTIIAGRDAELKAGRDLNLKAAESTTEEKSSEKSKSLGASVTVGVGVGGINISGGVNASASKSNSEGESKSYTNTKIIAGKSADLSSGRDTNLKGARVEAEELSAKVGRDLNIESVQNTSRFSSKSKGASFGLSTSLGGYSSGINITPDNLLNNALKNGDGQPIYNPKGVGGYGLLGDGKIGGSSWNIGINGSKGKGEFAWVQEQSGLVAENEVDVIVGGNTDLKAGIIASKSKDLSLDTGTLTFSDLLDKDKSKNVGGGISIGGPLSGGGDKSAGKTNPGDLNFTIEGQYAKKDKEGITRATVGEGEITIRDTEKQKELEESGQTQKLANLNRDLDKAQEVTKDEETEINIYVSSSSLKTLKKIGEAAANAIDNLVNEGKLSAESGKRVKDVMSLLEQVDPESLVLCGGSQGFNWHDVFFTKAYAAIGDACVIRFKGLNGLHELSPEEHAALRASIVKSTSENIKKLVPLIQSLVALEANGTLSKKEKSQLTQARSELQYQMAYFALCSDTVHDLRKIPDINAAGPQFEPYIKAAESYRFGGDKLAEEIRLPKGTGLIDLAKLRRENPQYFNALMVANYSHDGATVDAMYALRGVSEAKNSTSLEKQNLVKKAAEFSTNALFRVKQQKDPTGLGLTYFEGIVPDVLGQPNRAPIIDALSYVAKDLSDEDKGVYLSTLYNGQKLYSKIVDQSVQRARIGTLATITLAVGVQLAPAVKSCMLTPSCMAGMTEVAEGAALGDAIGGGSLLALPALGTKIAAGNASGVIDSVKNYWSTILTKVSPNKKVGSGFGNWPRSDVKVDTDFVIKQVDNSSCGQACGAMFLRDRGVDVKPIDIGEGLTTFDVSKVGALAKQIKEAAPDIKWSAGSANDTEDAFKILTRSPEKGGGSWIAEMREAGEKIGHAVVVDGVTASGKVIIRDPWDQTTYTMTKQDFINNWAGGFIGQ